MRVFEAVRRRFGKLQSSFFLVLLLIQLLLISLSVIFTSMAIEIINAQEDEKVRKVAKQVQDEIDRTGERAYIAALGAANSEKLVRAFEARDRKRLLEVAAPYWDELKRLGFKQFEFHLPSPELVTFLRMHDPERYGEELSSYRPTVVRCNRDKVPVVGLEQGHSGYGFRAVVPVMSNEKHIGSLEVGLDFAEGFLKTMDATYPGRWGIYNLIRGVNSISDQIIVASINDADGSEFKNVPPPANVLAKIENDEMFYEYSRANETITVYVPVKNFLNDVAVIVKHVYPTSYYSHVRRIILASAAVSVTGLALSALVIAFLYRQITFPIRKLVAQTERMKNLELDTDDGNQASLQEIQDLIDATRSMRIGLQSFQKYVPAQLVRQLIQTNQVANIGGRRKNLTLFFSDVADFTRISESLSPKELTLQLSDYLNEAAGIIIEEGGTVNQYLGDAIFAFWGAPLDHPDHARAACRAALRIQSRLALLSKRWGSEGRMPFPTRIGLNTGETIVGNIGSETRLYYTAIGDAVNLAARLETLNKHYGTWTLISEFVYEHCRNDFAVRMIDFVVVKGRSKPVLIYELVAEKGDISSNDLAFLDLFNEAVMLYKKREFEDARKIFLSLQVTRPDDKPTAIYLQRCAELLASPPPPDWDAAIHMKEK